MRLTLIIIVVLAELVSWRAVARRRKANEWNLMVGVFVVQGVVSLFAWHVELSTDAVPAVATAVGAVSGALLYAGTRVFVGVASRWPVFRAHVADRYERAREIRLPVALALAVVLAVPGEELFWRGFVQGFVGIHASEPIGAAVALAGYIGVNAASGSLPFLAAAVVGGLVWGGLTLFTGGILAALVCHGVWTGLMLGYPPREGRADGAPREMMPL